MSVKVKVNCSYCSKEFQVYPSRLKVRNICCSKECMGKFHTKDRTPNNVCPICDTSFYIDENSLTRVKTISSCSVSCANQLKKETYKGENNHQHGLKGDLNSSYKSDAVITNYGYVKIRSNNHPFRNYNDYILLHRVIYEEYLRKNDPTSEYLIRVNNYSELFLSQDYVIHHKDGNRLNNVISNLDIMTLGEHTSKHNLLNPVQKDEEGKFNGKMLVNNDDQDKQLYKKHKFDAGLDIRSNEKIIVRANSKQIIKTNLFCAIPDYHVGLIWSRSGLSAKHGIEVGAGCIDSSYRGEIKVLLYNHSDVDFTINDGDRIAQMLTIPININSYKKVDSLDDTERGEGGFNSTGVK